MESMDYKETFFSLVVRFASIHVILAIIGYLDLTLFQIDMKTTFFNREMEIVVFSRLDTVAVQTGTLVEIK